MKRLTKQEMYDAIVSKHPSLKALDIVGGYNKSGVSRPELFDIMIEFKIHKSRHLTKEQKERVKYEIQVKALNKL